jgi:hypothetical protein
MSNGDAANAGTDHAQRRLVEIAGQRVVFVRSGKSGQETEDNRMVSVWCWAYALELPDAYTTPVPGRAKGGELLPHL